MSLPLRNYARIAADEAVRRGAPHTAAHLEAVAALVPTVGVEAVAEEVVAGYQYFGRVAEAVAESLVVSVAKVAHENGLVEVVEEETAVLGFVEEEPAVAVEVAEEWAPVFPVIADRKGTRPAVVEEVAVAHEVVQKETVSVAEVLLMKAVAAEVLAFAVIFVDFLASFGDDNHEAVEVVGKFAAGDFVKSRVGSPFRKEDAVAAANISGKAVSPYAGKRNAPAAQKVRQEPFENDAHDARVDAAQVVEGDVLASAEKLQTVVPSP
ncbi:unnamed protein product [Litomosoides sigmodontis]|uniref:Uncharacterized protein n=1 Tax=Litomosoides sigmodontis TaxID=42156 RepID=A0A3P6TLR2_LITSI|nr:unnamed protein product [Litomosoides sigmodontis]